MSGTRVSGEPSFAEVVVSIQLGVVGAAVPRVLARASLVSVERYAVGRWLLKAFRLTCPPKGGRQRAW